ncbi:MAG: GNAT family N-acetyltransferase [Planctomycetota bacterium]
MPTLQQRLDAIDASAPPDERVIEQGCRADYLALKRHHYRPGNPMTMMRILAIREHAPTASDRFLSRAVTPRPIAVLVESLPALSCRLRDEALGGRYGYLRPKPRSQLLNQELRCISRVIVDPRYRGMGLAVRLVRHALQTAATRYTEMIAVMGRINPFPQRAGMTPYERPPLEAEQRALAALRYAGVEPAALAMPTQVQRRIGSLPNATQQLVTRELHRWYRTAGGRGVRTSPCLIGLLDTARHSLLANPVYYLKENTHAPAHTTGHTPDPDRSA